MVNNNKLNIGDTSENGQITIIDEDRLCYLVKSTSRGAYGIRTISKSLLSEYVSYFANNPDASANDARDALSGNSDIDKFEYGYTSTLKVMAQMVLGKIEITTTKDASIIKSKTGLPLQQIFYGAPGTGKSHTINEITELQAKENVFRTTFHPDSDYSTFVGCYKPTKEKSGQNVKQPILDYDSLVDKFKEYLSVPNANITKVCTQFGFDYHDSIVRIQEQGRKVMDLVNDAYKSNTSYDSVVRGGMACYEQVSSRVSGGSITYSFVPQSFTKAYLRAWQTTEPVYLVIEEINRGNCAQIFGDLFQLLDRKCDGFSEYPIKADNDLATYIAENLSASIRTDIPDSVRSGEELSLPSNLYIWATMNTSDQSLFPIDSAFKRRWDWKYVPIDTKKERWTINADGASYDWSDFLEKINAKIESATSSEDKMLGFYFCKAENNIVSAERFVNKVLFYLWNDVFRDYGFDDAVFNDKNNKKITFRMFYKADGKVDEAIVKEFLDNLGVNIKDNEEIIEIDDIDETNPAVANKNHLKNITFADGTVFSTNDMGPFDAYIEAIKKIGVDNVYSIADKLKYRRLNHPLISKEKYPEIENSTSYSYMQLGEYYFVKGSKTYTLVRMLEDIKNLLSIDMTINC
ncbi:MAG: DUF4268 domain-containing protein [Bacteroidales bacterium]|nr:DUF4268 domain-containing protein [Bacteroidales bacterium]